LKRKYETYCFGKRGTTTLKVDGLRENRGLAGRGKNLSNHTGGECRRDPMPPYRERRSQKRRGRVWKGEKKPGVMEKKREGLRKCKKGVRKKTKKETL